jgi:hypothetical protein
LNFIIIHQCRSVLFLSNLKIKKKSSEIILRARTLAISINIYLKNVYVLQIFNLHFIFNFYFSQLKKEQ